MSRIVISEKKYRNNVSVNGNFNVNTKNDKIKHRPFFYCKNNIFSTKKKKSTDY